MRVGLPTKSLKRMMTFVVLLIFIGCGTDLARLFYIQVIRGDEYAEKAQAQQLSDTEVAAMRGTIYDSDMNILAQSATAWRIYIDPKAITGDDMRTVLVDGLAKLFEYDEEEKADLAEKAQADNRYQVIENKVDNTLKEKISAFSSENDLNSVIGYEETTKRYYPYNSLASSVIGFTNYDGDGVYGLEAYYNDELSGKNGRVITAKDAVSNELPSDYATSVEAVDGNSLVLTINQNIQYTLEKGLSRTLEEYQCKGAYGVVMDVETGAVLAMSSLPDFDINNPYDITYSKTQKELDAIKDDEKRAEARKEAQANQWDNFTVSSVYEPGSVFKVFMSCAALEENVVTLDTTYNCTGQITVEDRIMHCHYHPGHGLQNLTQGLENSCNPFFITIGQRLGGHNYYKYFEGFGFTEKTGIDLPSENRSLFVSESDLSSKVTLSSASFGQTNSLTPIQVCTALAAVANGGRLMQPYLVSSVLDANGNTIEKTQPNEVRQVISEETAEKVLKMMKSVVDNGTGKNAYVAGYGVGGKTGTSTKLSESSDTDTKYIVSFGAVAPTDDPKVAALILIDEPNQDLGGGTLCAPIAAEVIETAMKEYGIEPKYTSEELEKLSVSTPGVTGKTVKTATSQLTAAGFEYKVIGDGSEVVKQSPAASTKIPSGGTVILYTESQSSQTVEVPDFTGLTVSEVNALAASKKLNVEFSGSGLESANSSAYRQSEESGTVVEIGSVITVTFKNNDSVLD